MPQTELEGFDFAPARAKWTAAVSRDCSDQRPDAGGQRHGQRTQNVPLIVSTRCSRFSCVSKEELLKREHMEQEKKERERKKRSTG
jgi:hypothetical protein